MINVLTVKTCFKKTNTYIVYSGTDAVIIDPADEYAKIADTMREHNLVCKYVLITHGHYDHINAVKAFQDEGAKVVICESEAHMIFNNDYNGGTWRGIEINAFKPDILVKDNDVLQLCDMPFRVLHTAGHTAGSACYVCENKIFSGDTLFYKDIGRTDLPTGDDNQMKASLKKLFGLKENCEIYPGHGKPTTLFFEKENNPYV